MDFNYTQYILDQSVLYVKQQRLVVDPLFVTAAAIFIYDYLLTLHREIKLIWFSQWTYTKVLFLLVRYLTFADTFLLLYNQLFFNVSADMCRWTYLGALWLVTLKMALAEVILALRTWAVWERSKVVFALLASIMFGNRVVQCVFTGLLTRHMIGYITEPMYPGFRGCNVGNVSVSGIKLPYTYLGLTCVEAVILTLMIISGFKLYRMEALAGLSEIVHRDGILFYIILLGITTANVVIGFSPLLVNLNTLMLTPLEGVLYSVLTTRIVLNIRQVGAHPNGAQTELHTSPMEFADPVGHHDKLTLEPTASTDSDVIWA